MPNIVSQRVEIRILIDDYFVIPDTADIEFSIEKDMDEEPNEAEITLYNIHSKGTIDQAANQGAPIEIWVSPPGSDVKSLAFKGEITEQRPYFSRPDFEIFIKAESQKASHRDFFVDKKTYAAGTRRSEIISFFIDTIGLPSNVCDLPDDDILLSQSFSGPAFTLLKNYVRDSGLYAYILDGTLHVSNIYEPTSPDFIDISNPALLLSSPEYTSREDDVLVENKVVFERRGRVDPFVYDQLDRISVLDLNAIKNNTLYSVQNRRTRATSKIKGSSLLSRSFRLKERKGLDYLDEYIVKEIVKKKKTRKRSRKEKKRVGLNDYESYTAIESEVKGIKAEMFCAPNINPDSLVSYGGELFRVQSVRHRGENFGEFTTEIQADLYSDDSGDIISEVLGL